MNFERVERNESASCPVRKVTHEDVLRDIEDSLSLTRTQKVILKIIYKIGVLYSKITGLDFAMNY
jgi:hypothetical protein